MSKTPSIQIGSVSIPVVDYAIGASAILGIRDSGKTVTSKGIAEQLLGHNVPIIVFDAVGKWRWMKVAGEGERGKAFKVVVAGGREPDLPLSPHSTPEIVRAALRERIPLIIDLFSKELSKADWRRIVQTAIHIIHYENEGGAVHVFLEEAAEFVPQKVYDGETYAEVEKLVRMGGNASVGITLINQRSQEINKAVLDNCSTALVLGCQVGKNAIEAVEKWIDRLDPETADEVTQSLPKLQSGEAWIWTRKSLDHPTRERMPMCLSFHPDRRTPEMVLKSAKATDTAEFVSKLAASIPKVIEQAKANDPAELKRTIAELRKQVQKAESAAPAEKPVEVPIFDAACRQLLERVERVCSEVLSETKLRHEQFEIIQKWLTEARHRVFETLDKAARVQKAPELRIPVRVNRSLNERKALAQNSGEVSGGLRRMLIALAQRPGLSKRQLGLRAGLSSKSGTFGTYLGRARSEGWIDGTGESLQITQSGLNALGRFDPLPEGGELLNYWLGELGQSGAGRMLEVLAEAYPKALTKEELGNAAAMSHLSGTFGTYLGRLRTLELVEGRGELRASREFFE